MSLHRPRPLGLFLLVLALAALPQALLAAPWPTAPPTQLPAVSSLLSTFWSWLGLASPDVGCGADPNGAQQCNSSGSNQRPVTQQRPLATSRRTSSGTTSSGGKVGTDTRYGLDPNGAPCVSGSRRRPAPLS
jgi:hypothetical protein